MHYQFNVKVVHTLTHLILPGHPTLPFEGFRGKYSVGQAHTYPCGQVYGFDRREGVARPESKHQIIIIICIHGEERIAPVDTLQSNKMVFGNNHAY